MTFEWFRIVQQPVPVDSKTRSAVLSERYLDMPEQALFDP